MDGPTPTGISELSTVELLMDGPTPTGISELSTVELLVQVLGAFLEMPWPSGARMCRLPATTSRPHHESTPQHLPPLRQEPSVQEPQCQPSHLNGSVAKN